MGDKGGRRSGCCCSCVENAAGITSRLGSAIFFLVFTEGDLTSADDILVCVKLLPGLLSLPRSSERILF